MKLVLIVIILALAATVSRVAALNAPTGVVTRTGDQSIVLHWDQNTETNLTGYKVYRSLISGGPLVATNFVLANSAGFCDLTITNGQANYYYVTALTGSQESLPSQTISATTHPFADDDEFLEYLQQTSFDYFWYGANPHNGLVPDRSAPGSPCSIAAVGFGLTCIGIGIDHGWISRTQGVARVLTTLNTFCQGPQGSNSTGIIGYNGWFYHFLDMKSAARSTAELSSIDTALLLAGIIYSREYFSGTSADEIAIRTTADAIFNRVDWNWMARGSNVLSMGWFPNSSFISSNWIGYNEAMVLYCLALGATNPLPASAWDRWTSGYTWATYYGQSYVPFAALFAHQYSHCWIDFRHIADAYMNAHNSTYFENSRRATLAQRQYCIGNPNAQSSYSSNVWGLTACDGPERRVGGITYAGYAARGAPAGMDDGTIAPTAAGGSIPFAPEHCIPTLRYLYSHFRKNIWTENGFRDAFNLRLPWWDPDELGIDQGPIVIMIENYRTQRVWKLFMQNVVVQRGLRRAGFVRLPVVATGWLSLPSQNAFSLSWEATAGRNYQIEYSTDLDTWFGSPAGDFTATGPTATWTDSDPSPATSRPFSGNERFYRVFQLGAP
jgi:hypothetical protein